MKSILTLCLAAIAALSLHAEVSPRLLAEAKASALIKALHLKESKAGQVKSKGDQGRAWGPLQTWRVVVTDVNKAFGTKFKHEDTLKEDVSFVICHLYLTLWAKEYERRTGLVADNSVKARIWNGGPLGWRKKATLSYWRDVKEILKGV